MVELQYYTEQLECGVLRQGWGQAQDQNLRQLSTKDPEEIRKDMRPNMRMYCEVKKGDILLIPRIPRWEAVTIARATEDWEVGYEFEIDPELRDFGHKFPAEFIKAFTRQNKHVSGGIRTTLKCRSRFWNIPITHKEEIDRLIDSKESLIGDQNRGKRFEDAVLQAVGESDLSSKVHDTLSRQFANVGWEYALVSGLQALFPGYQIERTAGSEEARHGTDILVTIPGLTEDRRYGIAIQVKDWQGKVDSTILKEAIDQIEKSEEYWKENRSVDVIEKMVIISRTTVDSNEWPGGKDDVTILDEKELRVLLRRMALATGAMIVNQEASD